MPIPTLYEIRSRNNPKKVKSIPMSGPLGKHMFRDEGVRPRMPRISEDSLVISNDRWRDREN